jgi:uncharacterized protein (DUF488 family)
MNGSEQVLTVGHSTHSTDEFVGLLKQHAVTAVADVRSSPFSRYAPQFNKDSLRSTLREHCVHYVFLGRELGARSSDPGCYVDGRVQYSLLARTALFKEGIDRILSGARMERVALMCTEKDPLDCHRTLLVACHLVNEGVPVAHILPDGSVEAHDAAMLRLLDRLGMQPGSLFQSTNELVADALAKQEQRIAYVDTELADLRNRSA